MGRGVGCVCVAKCKCIRRPLLQIKCQDVKYCQFHFAARGMTNPYSSLNKTLTAAEGGGDGGSSGGGWWREGVGGG